MIEQIKGGFNRAFFTVRYKTLKCDRLSMTHNKSSERVSPENTAILLIDHQIGTIKLAISTPRDEIIRNTRALARTAVETGMPLVLSTSQEDQFQGPLLEDLREIAPTAYEERIKRPGVIDAWLYEPFRKAVEKTGRKKIIMAGLTNDVCVVYPAISAFSDGYEIQVVVDAGGSPTKMADDVALRRIESAGITLTSTNQVLAELARDWETPKGRIIIKIMYEEILGRLMEQ